MIYVVTERVIPLEIYLQKQVDKLKTNALAISWGLHQTAVNKCLVLLYLSTCIVYMLR